MEQVPSWLDAAVAAAGMSTVYIAEDWAGNAARKGATQADPAVQDPPKTLD